MNKSNKSNALNNYNTKLNQEHKNYKTRKNI